MWPYASEESGVLEAKARSTDRPARRSFSEAIVSTLRLWARRRRERDELARLTVSDLQDIGITRVEAEWMARKPFWRE